ncbi:Ataxin-10 [Phlyctochytrium planicorne]|nr:Ataxin-10 [Phlyctochytrium planicorne]
MEAANPPPTPATGGSSWSPENSPPPASVHSFNYCKLPPFEILEDLALADGQFNACAVKLTERLNESWRASGVSTESSTGQIPIQNVQQLSCTLKNIACALVPDEMLRSDIGKIPNLWTCLASASTFIRNEILMTFGGPDECGVSCPTRAVATLELATAFFQIIRNLCASVPTNQMRASQLCFYKTAEVILAYECSWLISTGKPCSDIRSKVKACVNMGTQMLANMMTGNEQLLNALYPRFFLKESELLLQLLKTSDSQTCKFVLIELLVSTTVGRNLVIILLREAEKLYKEDNPNFDIIYGLIVNMVELDLTAPIMKSLCVTMPSTSFLGHEQIIFMKMLDGMIESRLGSGPNAVAAMAQHCFSAETCKMFCRIMKKLVRSLEKVIDAVMKDPEGGSGATAMDLDDSPTGSMGSPSASRLVPSAAALTEIAQEGYRPDLETSSTPIKPEHPFALFANSSNPNAFDYVNMDAYLIILQYFTRALCGEDDPTAGTQTTARRVLVMKEGLGATLLAFLMMLSKLKPPAKPSSPSASPVASDEVSKKLNEIVSLKVDAIKVIANMCYGVPEVQDEFRNLGGIPIVLNHCKIDDSNPFIREWSIFAIRNLCENNAKNQALIASMEARGMAPDDGTLAAAGLKARLTPEGKVKISPIN